MKYVYNFLQFPTLLFDVGPARTCSPKQRCWMFKTNARRGHYHGYLSGWQKKGKMKQSKSEPFKIPQIILYVHHKVLCRPYSDSWICSNKKWLIIGDWVSWKWSSLNASHFENYLFQPLFISVASAGVVETKRASTRLRVSARLRENSLMMPGRHDLF